MQSHQLLREEKKDPVPDKEDLGNKKNLSTKWNGRLEKRRK